MPVVADPLVTFFWIRCRFTLKLGRLTKLTGIAVSGNDLSGPLPSEFGRLTILRELDCMAAGLTGQLPSDLGQLPQLRRLSLTGNNFSGNRTARVADSGSGGHINPRFARLFHRP